MPSRMFSERVWKEEESSKGSTFLFLLMNDFKGFQIDVNDWLIWKCVFLNHSLKSWSNSNPPRPKVLLFTFFYNDIQRLFIRQWKSVFSKAPVGLNGTRLSTPKLHTKRITRVRQPICRFWIHLLACSSLLLFLFCFSFLCSFYCQLLIVSTPCCFFFIHLIFPYVFRITFPKLYIFALIKQKKVKFWSAHFFQFRSNRLLSFLRQCFTAFSRFSVFVLIHPHYILLTDISFLCLCFC